MLKFYVLLGSMSLIFAQNSRLTSDSVEVTSPTSIQGKYKVGDTVKCSRWENESYWEGKVVRIIKDVVYQVELETIRVNGSFKLYLNPSECTGKKRLSLEDGKDYKRTKIWVHERCLDWFIT